jgi:hypothetical protein
MEPEAERRYAPPRSESNPRWNAISATPKKVDVCHQTNRILAGSRPQGQRFGTAHAAALSGSLCGQQSVGPEDGSVLLHG